MIHLYTVSSVRQTIEPYFPGTAAARYADSRPAVYDHPYRGRAEVVADFIAGRPTPGDAVTVEVLGEGTTVAVYGRSESRGWDDHDWCTYATFRTPEGTWREVLVAVDGQHPGNTATADASAEVLAAYEAHLEAERARVRAEEHARREAERLARELRERAAVDRGRFVIVAKGRKVPVGIVGRVFYTTESEFGDRAGIATSTRTEQRMSARGRMVDAAVDVVWVAASNLDVLLEELPASPAEVELLYRCAAAVCDHARARQFAGQRAALAAADAAGEYAPPIDTDAPVVDAFTALWRWAVERPERLAVMLAYRPAELPRLDADAPRTLEEVCEAVETAYDVARELSRRAAEWDGSDDARAVIRASVEGCLGVVYAPPVKARRTREAKATA